MRTPFGSRRRRFRETGPDAYVRDIQEFAAGAAGSVPDEDRASVELQARLAGEHQLARWMAHALVSAGYFWARAERWLAAPVVDWTWEPDQRLQAERVLTQQHGLASEQAAVRLEVSIVKSGLDDLMPPRDEDMPTRLAHYREVTVDSLLALDTGRKPSPSEAGEAQRWMAQHFDWGVAIGARRRLYEHSRRSARKLLSDRPIRRERQRAGEAV